MATLAERMAARLAAKRREQIADTVAKNLPPWDEPQHKEEIKVDIPPPPPPSHKESLKDKLARMKAEQRAKQAASGIVKVDDIAQAYEHDSTKSRGSGEEGKGEDPGSPSTSIPGNDEASDLDDIGNSAPPITDSVAEIVHLPTAEEFVHESQPEKLSDAAEQQFRQALEALKQSFENEELVGQSIAYTMRILQENPHIKDNLAPSDIGDMVRGLRVAYGAIIIKKQAKAEKKQKKSEDIEDVASFMRDAGFEV